MPDSYSINNSDWLQKAYQDKNGYIFGLTNTVYQTAAKELMLGNSNVTWETALKQNYGIDAYFFSDRLKLTVDYFRENRRDILIQRSTVPSLIAMNGILPVVNMGKVNNQGYEVDLKWNDRIKDFSYYINANVSYSKNKIIYQDEVNRTNLICGVPDMRWEPVSDIWHKGSIMRMTLMRMVMFVGICRNRKGKNIPVILSLQI